MKLLVTKVVNNVSLIQAMSAFSLDSFWYIVNGPPVC